MLCPTCLTKGEEKVMVRMVGESSPDPVTEVGVEGTYWQCPEYGEHREVYDGEDLDDDMDDDS